MIERWLVDGPAAAPDKRCSSWANDASHLRQHVIPLLGAIDVSALRRADIEHAQRDVAAGATAADVKTGPRGRAIVRGARAVARAAMISLSSCLSWAVSQELAPSNPVTKIKKIAAAKRERFLSDVESARLLDTIAAMQAERVLGSAFADAFRLLLLTGARKSEIACLAWDEVDIERAVIKLVDARSKNGEKATMLNAPAVALIAGRPRIGRFVFPSSVDASKPIVGLQKIWERVRTRAEVPGVRMHDLRHSFASFAAAGGATRRGRHRSWCSRCAGPQQSKHRKKRRRSHSKPSAHVRQAPLRAANQARKSATR